MCKVSDNTRSDTGSDCTCEDTGSGNGSEAFARIKSANRKVRLLDCLRHYGFKIEPNFQRQKWSYNIICPLPNHKGAKERTPSFGYCFITDHFNCLGCHQSGRAVEFISLYERISRGEVADKILSQYGEDSISDEDNDYADEISPILLDGSVYLQNIIQQNKNNPKKLKEINKLIWWLDFYLISKAPMNQIIPDELKYRIDRIKELV